MFKKLLDNTRESSPANKFRKERLKYFNELTSRLPRPVKILDVGGTENFWVQMGYYGNYDYDITILNITNPAVQQKDNLKFLKGSAVDLSAFDDKSFDVVFSNSVIEHIPGSKNRSKMASEIKRVGKCYFVQTPNYYFPFEPHFLFPFFQFFPKVIKIFLLKNFSMGWFGKCSTSEEAAALLENNKLLKLSEFKGYFNDAVIIKEKLLFMNKSFIAVKK